jgi:DNA-binding Lrp family transcriptional regulator
VKLSDIDREIIVASQNAAQLSAPEIASLIGRKTQSVRFRLSKLKEAKVVEPFTMIDLYRLGLSEYGMFVSITNVDEDRLNDVIGFLLDWKAVAHISKVGGDFNYHFALYARSEFEYLNLRSELADRFPEVLSVCVTAIRVSIEEFGCKYLTDKLTPPNTLKLGHREKAEIDGLDARICDLLSLYPDLSNGEYARRLGIPATTFSYRLDKLEEKGVLVGAGYRFDTTIVGMQSYRILLGVKDFSSAVRSKVRALCLEHDNIVCLIEVLGPWDYEIMLDVEDSSQAHFVMEGVRSQLEKSVSHLTLMPSFGNLKSLKYSVESLVSDMSPS